MPAATFAIDPNLRVVGMGMDIGESFEGSVDCTESNGDGMCTVTQPFLVNTEIMLTAMTGNSRLVDWTAPPCPSASGTSCNFTLTGPTEVEMTLSTDEVILTVEVIFGTANDPTRVTLNPPALGGESECVDDVNGAAVVCPLRYLRGQVVEIRADTQNDPFERWDPCPGTTSGTLCTVTMSQDESVTARFQ